MPEQPACLTPSALEASYPLLVEQTSYDSVKLRCTAAVTLCLHVEQYLEDNRATWSAALLLF